jgi:hypothetical protein
LVGRESDIGASTKRTRGGEIAGMGCEDEETAKADHVKLSFLFVQPAAWENFRTPANNVNLRRNVAPTLWLRRSRSFDVHNQIESQIFDVTF